MTEVELRQAIAGALKRFQTEPLSDAATHLWDVLGYASKKRLALKPNTLSTFLSMFSHGRALSDLYAKPDDWKSVDFLFQLTDGEVRTSANQQFNFESKGAYNGSIINSYLFFAIELKGSHYSRTTLAGITREVNKLFDMPALILFRHGETLTLAIINRRLHKREAGKDVLEKVTLIQDIQLTHTHRAHIDILADLSLSVLHRRHPFTNFVGLHEAWQKTLDTSELNKRFFQDLANWYFWALPQVRFPKNAHKDADGQDSLSLIRLITRVIFCWFLKEKGLLPEALFDEHAVPALLADLSPKESTYYKAILQNLFFATLNQEMDKREFRKTGQNFMAHNLYRYKSLMKTPSETLKLLEEVPFMNGGLFECLDKRIGTKETPKDIRVDGFSDRDDNVLKVPNDLFWGTERVVDLSDAYGENRYKSSKVSGLVRIFNRYKFTVAENTPIEEEVALDPELLGRVFENLLAAYNPETGATARKQTGSFYTPREIVNYMVDESLMASLNTKLAAALPEAAKSDERLRQLFAYNDQAHEFTEPEVIELIKAIDHLTILDPACGSGAFPMGILHKLVFVLGKLDPHNQRWKAQQVAKASEFTDFTVRELAISEIEKAFRDNELDYGRKLYLIENCIYGIDIQPIAVQIAKLRFFISLVVEQNADANKDNFGIRPLPNLETKFAAANSLIALERPGQQLLRSSAVDAKESELRRVRERYFLARTPATKEKYREEDTRLRSQLGELLKGERWDAATASEIASWDPYDQNVSATFFDAEWMFALKEGFDIVIANPPYIGEKGHKELFTKIKAGGLAQFYLGKVDIFYFFFHFALNVARRDGCIAFITTNYFPTADGARKLRRDIRDRATVTKLLNLGDVKLFEAALGQHNMITILSRAKEPKVPAHNCITKRSGVITSELLQQILQGEDSETEYFDVAQDDLYDGADNYIRINGAKGNGGDLTHSVLNKLSSSELRLADICVVNIGMRTGADKVSQNYIDLYNLDLPKGKGIYVLTDEERKGLRLSRVEQSMLLPFFKNSDISKYYCKSTNDLWLIDLTYPKYKNVDWDALPQIRDHIWQFKTILESRRSNDNGLLSVIAAGYWWCYTLRQLDFSAEKIVSPQRSMRNKFALSTSLWVASMDVYYITPKSSDTSLRYILALLNSRLYYFWLYHRGKRKGEALELYQKPLSEIPIKLLDASRQRDFIKLVDRIMLTKHQDPKADTRADERALDDLVYALYELTPDEVQVVTLASERQELEAVILDED